MARKSALAAALFFLTITLLLFVGLTGVAAQPEQPVVYGVFFYSPTCPHCHKVITEDWPGIRERFGEQLQVLFIDVTTPGGQQMAAAAYDQFGIPPDDRGVPMMIIGSEIMIGDIEIPGRAPDIIQTGLDAGGIALPDIPGLQESYDRAVAQATEQAASAQEAAVPTAAPTESAEVEGETEPEPVPAPVETDAPVENVFDRPSVMARLARDPLGNGLAIAVLLALGMSFSAVVTIGLSQSSKGAGGQQAVEWLKGRSGWWVVLLIALVGAGLALTLVAEAGGSLLARMAALGVALVLLVTVGVVVAAGLRGDSTQERYSLPGWLVALVAFGGVLVAGYMAYVEVTQTEAICGIVGDCNTVQQSAYARLFGVLPVGEIGIAGTLAILLAWAIGHAKAEKLARLARMAVLGMALIGTLFSFYLTFLEPFVIGATCAWCLTSAIIMLLLLWLSAPAGWAALRGET